MNSLNPLLKPMFNVTNTILGWMFKKFRSVFCIEMNVRLFFINSSR